jgi:hypothetical protein
VVDPTRFVFEAAAPSLWLGSIDDYDLGANRLRERRRGPPPEHSSLERQVIWIANESEVTDRVAELLGDTGLGRQMTLSWPQAFWLANNPPEVIGDLTPEIFRALAAVGCGGLIPLDNRDHALGCGHSP